MVHQHKTIKVSLWKLYRAADLNQLTDIQCSAVQSERLTGSNLRDCSNTEQESGARTEAFDQYVLA